MPISAVRCAGVYLVFGEENQVVKRGRKCQGCGEEYFVEKEKKEAITLPF